MFSPGEVVVVLTSPTTKAVGTISYRWYLNGVDVVYTVQLPTGLQVFFADDVSAVPKVCRGR